MRQARSILRVDILPESNHAKKNSQNHKQDGEERDGADHDAKCVSGKGKKMEHIKEGV